MSTLGHDEPLYAAYVGPAWDSYYRERFERLVAGAAPIQWNWAAALVPFWAEYRKLRGSGLLYVLFPIAVTLLWSALTNHNVGLVWGLLLSYGGLLVLFGVALGALGTWSLLAQSRRAIQRARSRSTDDALAVRQLATRAPKRGLVADLKHGSVSFVGYALGAVFILIGMPHHHDPQRAYGFAMRSDLRNMAVLDSAYFAANGRHAVALDSLLRFVPSIGVTVNMTEATADGWRAEARHARSDLVCQLFVGLVSDTPVGAAEGKPQCYRRRRDGTLAPER